MGKLKNLMIDNEFLANSKKVDDIFREIDRADKAAILQPEASRAKFPYARVLGEVSIVLMGFLFLYFCLFIVR